MKSAAYKDIWRDLRRKPHPLTPATYSLEDAEFSANINIHSPVTVIAGLNGAGKSRILRSIKSTLGSQARLVPLHALCDWLLYNLASRDDLFELADEAAEIVLPRNTLDAMQSVIGRKYDAVKWHSLDISESPFFDVLQDDVVPYFYVQYGDLEYDFRHMGLGELSVHVLMWILSQIEKSESNLVILLDEPDSYIPPYARQGLFDHFGYLASLGHIIIATSHSQEFVVRALDQPNGLIIASREGAMVKPVSEPEDVREVVAGVLFRNPSVQLLAFVEDEAAYIFTQELLKQLSMSLSRSTRVYWCQGTGSIDALRKFLPRPPRGAMEMSMLFVVDGDQPAVPHRDNQWPTARLPGDSSPDELFMDHCWKEAAFIAEALGKSEAVVDLLFQSIAAQEPHDWTDAFLVAADVERQMGFRILCQALLRGPEGPSLLAGFKKSLLDVKLAGLPRFLG